MNTLLYRLNRFLLKLIARPSLTGADNLPGAPAETVYVLHHRSLTDLAMLDLVCADAGLVSPHALLACDDFAEPSRFFSLYRAKGGRMTMASQSQRLMRLLDAPTDLTDNIVFIPVSVFWGRAMKSESVWNSLTSEHWAVTGRFKRLINLLFNRRDIFVHTGRPLPLKDIADPFENADIVARRVARLLRVRMRQQQETTLGPDFSHRRTLVDQVVNARAVRDVIQQEVKQGAKADKVRKRAVKSALTIASDMSYPTIRVLARLLSWFWNRIYDGIEVSGLQDLEATSASHCLVYVPSHRSHLDYLLLSYLLYYRGFMIPHIAAGDNLNLPLLGSILRRGGAFFMRRSFRDDPLYAAVFNEYLYQVYRRGHCVEFFPEGGRTRTGRLLPARMGLLKMSVDHQQRGLPKPLAFVPVYFGYEKVVEAASYLSELRGADKEQESVGDVFRNLKLIRQNFGGVKVNLGKPIKLDEWLAANGAQEDALARLGKTIMQRINRQASLNPVNLVALVTLATPKIAIEEHRLEEQIACYQQLLTELHEHNGITVSELSARQVIEHVEGLGMLHREEEPFGPVLSHTPFNAVLMTWYRNNVVHTLALPSLAACLMVKRRRGISLRQLQDMMTLIFPYLANELAADNDLSGLEETLAVMARLNLLRINDAEVAPPDPEQPEHLQLTLLANLVSQTLERMFIVIHRLTEGPISREELLASSRTVAQRMSRLYGINAPEFSDQGLFDQFIDTLMANGVLSECEDGTLSYDPVLQRVMRAAEFVIDPQIRHGVASASHQHTA